MNSRIRVFSFILMLVVGYVAWFMYGDALTKKAGQVQETVETIDLPMLTTIPGGVLEVSVIRVVEEFSRVDAKEVWRIPLGNTISKIKVPVFYRYHIQMEQPWSIRVLVRRGDDGKEKGRVAIVQTGPLMATMPVAFESSQIEQETQSGWARFNKDENVQSLALSLSPILAKRAQGQHYKKLATQNARHTVKQFVQGWLLREPQWKADPNYEIVVVFPGETPPIEGLSLKSPQ